MGRVVHGCTRCLVALLPLLAFVWAVPVARADCIASSGDTVALFCPRGPSYGEATLSISHDDGAHWTSGLGTGLGSIEDACVTEAGEVVALVNEPSPHLVREDGTTASVPVDTGYALRSGRDGGLYVVGQRESVEPSEAVLLASHDGGAHWDELGSLPHFASLGAFDVTSRGGDAAARIWSIEGLSCFGVVIDRLYVHRGRLFTSVLRDDMACAYHGEACSEIDVVGLGAHGAVYGRVAHGDERWTAALIRPGERVESMGLAADDTFLVGHNGSITLAVVDGSLLRFDGARHRVLGTDVPTEVYALHVDERGRAWVISPSGLHRFSRGAGFELIRSLE